MAKPKPLAESMLGKPFHPKKQQGLTPAFVRRSLDITDRTSRKDDGVSIVLVMGFQGGRNDLYGPNNTFFGLCMAEDDITVRRSVEEIETNRKEGGGPCFTENESFGFERTYGMTTDEYKKIVLMFAASLEH